jgi:hypothetical protein
MKSAMRLSVTLSLLAASMMFVGCASDCGGRTGNGIFGTQILQGQPVRSTIRSWFRGDDCDSCNVPAGQMSAPCNNCNNGLAPMSGIGFDQSAQPLYGTQMNEPLTGDVQLGVPNQMIPQPGPAVGSGTRNSPPTGF